MTKRITWTTCALAGIFGAATFVVSRSWAADNPVPAPAASSPSAGSASAYLLRVCPVSGEMLGTLGEPVKKVYDGREVQFCCKNCVQRFESDKGGYLAKIDAALAGQQKPFYPLETCVVSGENLATMDSVVDHIEGNRLVRLGANCVEKFKAAPAAHLKTLDEAVLKQQRPNYPTELCIVSGDKLGGDMGEPIDYIVGNRLIRLCCKSCIHELNKEPAKYLRKLDEISAGAAPTESKNPGAPAPHDAHTDHGARDGHTGHKH